MLPDDPARAHPDSEVVAHLDALSELVASEIVATLTVVFGAVRARAPFGLRGMWGSLADGLGGGAALDAVNRGIDVSETWREAMQLLDAIAARTPLMRVRPRLRELEWSGGVSGVVVRGTCCLYDKTHDAPDPRGEGYCTSCPLRDPDDQLDRWRDWLEATYGQAAIDTTGRPRSLI